LVNINCPSHVLRLYPPSYVPATVELFPVGYELIFRADMITSLDGKAETTVERNYPLL